MLCNLLLLHNYSMLEEEVALEVQVVAVNVWYWIKVMAGIQTWFGRALALAAHLAVFHLFRSSSLPQSWPLTMPAFEKS